MLHPYLSETYSQKSLDHLEFMKRAINLENIFIEVI